MTDSVAIAPPSGKVKLGKVMPAPMAASAPRTIVSIAGPAKRSIAARMVTARLPPLYAPMRYSAGSTETSETVVIVGTPRPSVNVPPATGGTSAAVAVAFVTTVASPAQLTARTVRSTWSMPAALTKPWMTSANSVTAGAPPTTVGMGTDRGATGTLPTRRHG